MTTDIRRPVINPGVVEWTGENPGIWLRQPDGAAYSTLVTGFRLVHSVHGAGNVTVVLMDPDGHGAPDRPNVCATDNLDLARHLVDTVVTRFSVFRDIEGMKSLRYHLLDTFGSSGTTTTEWVERGSGTDLELELTWSSLGDPYYVEIPSASSPTGCEIFATFIEASGASVVVNGHRAVGQPSTRDFYGSPASTAFLAFSETWIRPQP